MDKQRILVTGGSGFIGTNYILHLLKKGNVQVLNLDINPAKVSEISSITKFCDIRNYELLKQSFMDFNPHYIVHLAARTDLDGKTIEEYDSNTLGTQNILKVIPLLKELKKVVLTSSMLVCKTGYSPKSDFDYAPSTLYGESKVQGEKSVWENQPACDWAIIRPTSIWGPWFGVPYKNFFDMVLGHKYSHIGHKSCTKTYGYVGNAIYQIEQIRNAKTKEKIFYIGDGAYNIEEWANEIAEQLNSSIVRMPFFIIKMAALFGDCLKIFRLHFPMTSFRLKNMTTNNIVDISRTSDVAPNLPYTRKDGIKCTLEWMNANH